MKKYFKYILPVIFLLNLQSCFKQEIVKEDKEIIEE
jgi:hypothetical protein